MLLGKDVKKTALRAEEAALLPAMARQPGRGAALRTALRAADSMKDKRVNGDARNRIAGDTRNTAPPVPAFGRAKPRAALNHVLRR